MNINQNINKLLYALKQKGQIYRIDSFQFFNEKKDKYCTKYKVKKRELLILEDLYWDVEIDDEELYNPKLDGKERYKDVYTCYSKIDLIKYLKERLLC